MNIIQKGDFNGDIISTTLSNRHIPNLELFLNPDNTNDSDPMNFSNSEFGRKLLIGHLTKNSKIVILVDADADGYTSAAVLYQYLEDFSPTADLHYIVHEDKAHGLNQKAMDKIFKLEPNLVITPDAGSNDIAQIELLEAKGIDILVLDHHVVSEFTEKGTIINNQLCPLTNHSLVGAGVVYKFVQGIDVEYGTDYAEFYLDLVAIGQIGDASDISDPEIRNLVMTGLDNINNPFLKIAITNKLGLVTSVAPKEMSFNVIPLINAVTRVGTMEEREMLFEAMASIKPERRYDVIKKKKNKDTGKFDNIPFVYTTYQYGFDLAVKAKSRQDTVVKKMVAVLETSVVDDAGIIIAYSNNNDNPGITGLIANKLMSKFDKPVLLLNEQEETFTGSGRGKETVLEDFRVWCENSGLIEFARGHDNAFGICIRKDKLNEFKEYSRTIKKQDTLYEVDLITSKPDVSHCQIIDENKRLFGGSVSEPFIGISGINVPKRFISIKGNMLTIYSYGVSMVQFVSKPAFVEKMMNIEGDFVDLNIVGYYSMNNWSGRLIPQLIIKDIELVEKVVEEMTEDNLIF